MPYRSCAAVFCGNNSNTAKQRGLDIVFHSFPSENDLYWKWIQFCDRDENWTPNKSAAICSQHFRREDYQLGNTPLSSIPNNIRRLHLKAIPTVVNTNIDPVEQPENTETCCNVNVLEHDYQNPLSNNASHETLNENIANEKDAKIAALELELKKLQNVQKTNETLTEHNRNLRNNLERLNTENKLLQKKILFLKKVHDKKQKSTTKISAIKNLLKNTLSANQIDLILNRKKRVIWTKEEISAALTLKYLSTRAYKYLLKDLKYPLPSFSTLLRYAKKINLSQGILEDMIRLVGTLSNTWEPRDRECVLSFDEMKICKMMEYDQATDEVVGPYNYLQVVMARGLFHKWKQPVFLGFDKKMTKDIIVTLIQKLAEQNINVVAIVSDNSSSNLGCWRELGVHNPIEPYFKHPKTDKNVYIVPDAPHLLKLLRNWFIDHGFLYKGQVIKADLLFDLVAKRDQAELTPLYKLTRNHLIMTSHEKQNVRRAAQVLSRTTAISLRQYYPENDEASKLADFIEVVDLWFSISNSYTPFAKLDYKKSFTGNENQKKALQDMFDLISTMTIIDKAGMQIFQKSLLMQITSLSLIFEDMQQKHGITFISTHKVMGS
uniref:THAP-type domain-containing protein n=1 Tax=Anopheles gambiae TaxID=7165 RepID=A0A453Z0R0_ANOGA